MANGNFFVSLPLDKQFTSLLADSTVREQLLESLSRRKAPENTGVSDITDGVFYKQQREKLNCRKQDLTLTMSADGSPMFKSSNYSIWPVHFTLNELPPHLRWRNVICSLLWYGTKHPNMTLLLQAFADQMRELARDGISWNAGCAKYPVTVAVDDRTEASTLSDMTSAAATSHAVNGVKGPLPLINVPGFDTVWSFRPDYMHCVLLGAVRQVTELWFSNVGEDHYIGAPRTLAVVDQRLQGQRLHLCFNRPPRSIKLRKYWKASEWEAWLLYYCLPCLRDILPEELLEHFALLVSGLYLLLQNHVTLEDVDTSTTKITKFVVLMQYHYGEAQITPNVHTLLHLPKSVLLHGPLWSQSCFEFENNMGHLLKLVSSSNGIPFQILSRILLRNNYHQLRSMASEEMRKQCSQKMPDRETETRLLGKPQPVSQDVTDFVLEHLTGVDKIEEYHRVSVGGCTIHSEQYKPLSKRDSTGIKLGDVYAKVENIGAPVKAGVWRVASPRTPSSAGGACTLGARKPGEPSGSQALRGQPEAAPDEPMDVSWAQVQGRQALLKLGVLTFDLLW
ncbi:hypothetical protein HPB47_000199 [Ixodes persulcatus]|uniref:Uncharacterized protein n=1 Tax=Ixodes persulcatus TaxID=34615 RepID=A0AC60PSG9_IXOPE|nr:hypothetical protein HPB47_000199 [Ixodes persulcatus]